MKAFLALETGRVFEGTAFGARRPAAGEVVFCTALSGYQEIMTDPSYQGQIVVMTYPHIGNYGISPDFNESKRPHLAGYVAREFSSVASHWKSTTTIEEYMKNNGVVGLHGVDTRALVRHLREKGVCRGLLSTDEKETPRALVARAKKQAPMTGADLVKEVTCADRFPWPSTVFGASGRKKVALLDYGAKFNIMNSLVAVGCDVTVFPAATKFETLRAFRPDGIMLSNGPGDPAAVTYAIDTLRDIVSYNETAPVPLPVFGICLGHQLLALALGGKTFKLKFGHRGANHPVKNLMTGQVEVTTQNHGFAVDIDSLHRTPAEPTHINLNDQTLEGLRHKTLPLFSVQYHPEACPGPHDAHYLFNRFSALMSSRTP